MYSANPYNTYKQNSINMASKNQLLLMLVDATVKCTKMAKMAIENKNIQVAHRELIRVQDIYTELMATLDVSSGSFANELYNLYSFIKEKIALANMKKDISIIDEVLPLIEEIRDIWHEANKINNSK